MGGRRGAFGVRTRLGVCAIALAGVLGSAGLAVQPAAAQGKGGGGTVTYLASQEPSQLVPDTGLGGFVGLGGAEKFAIYDALAVLTLKGQVDYRLADSITSTNDTVWSVKLRKGLAFSDGTPLDASAVQYNWSRMADPAQRSPSAAIAQTIASMNVVDPSTLEVTLKEPNAQFPQLVGQSALATIASPTAWEAAGSGFGSSPVGAGPYMVKEWQRGAQLVLERNPKYKGKTRADEIVTKYIPDATQETNTLTTGGGDFFIAGDIQVVNTAKQQPSIGNVDVIPNGGNNIFFNLTKPPFDDLRARQAIAYAFDAKALNDAVNGGAGQLAPNLFLKNSQFYEAIPQPKPDKKKAQKLFDELAAEGKPLEFTVATTTTFQKMAEWFQARLASFNNVKMNIEPVTGNQVTQNWQQGNFTLSLSNIPRFVDPAPALSNFYETGGSTNYGKYSNPEVDAALKEARKTNDTAQRKDAYGTVQRAQVKDLPAFFFLRTTTVVLYNKDKLQKVEVYADGLPRWDRISAKGA